MSARIIVPPFLKHLIKDESVIVEGNTVGACLNEFVKKYPAVRELIFDESQQLNVGIEVYLNGESTYPGELSKPVNAGDELYIAFIITGG